MSLNGRKMPTVTVNYSAPPTHGIKGISHTGVSPQYPENFGPSMSNPNKIFNKTQRRKRLTALHGMTKERLQGNIHRRLRMAATRIQARTRGRNARAKFRSQYKRKGGKRQKTQKKHNRKTRYRKKNTHKYKRKTNSHR